MARPSRRMGEDKAPAFGMILETRRECSRALVKAPKLYDCAHRRCPSQWHFHAFTKVSGALCHFKSQAIIRSVSHLPFYSPEVLLNAPKPDGPPCVLVMMLGT